jgi:D-3-phosphoglycerate dehydrogenase / 2-oxoglutarate reductase
MQVLAIGDSFLNAAIFERGLAPLARDHTIAFVQIDETVSFAPKTPSEFAIREFAGNPGEVASHLDGVEALVVHAAAVTDDVLDASPNLRLVCCARGGPVNVDVAAASRRGIPVVTTPGKNAEAVAEQTIAFAIMLARRFPSAQRYVLGGGTVGESALAGGAFLGHELRGRCLGLVGFGHVGRAVARIARGFGVLTIAYDPFVSADGHDDVERVERIETLLSRADFVSLHARSTTENEHLVDESFLAHMRDGAYLINTARELLVDERALDRALATGRLAGAALDVLRPAQGNAPHPLLRHDNVIITPHIGGATEETLIRGASMVAEEIQRFAAGEPLLNVANPSAANA